MRILSVHCTAEMSPLIMKLIASKLLLSNITVAQKLIVKLSIYGKWIVLWSKLTGKLALKASTTIKIWLTLQIQLLYNIKHKLIQISMCPTKRHN